MLPRVVWAEESKNGLRFEIGPSYDVIPTRSQCLTDGQSSCTSNSSLSSLCEPENMLSKKDNILSLPDFHREKFIQNCLMDYYVANEEDLSPERATLHFEANHNKLNRDQKRCLITSKD